MIPIKSESEIRAMREAGKLAGQALAFARKQIRPGMSTMELNLLIHNFIKSHGAYPTFLGQYDFPASACISLNEQVIHGIPSKKVRMHDGDLVKVDVGVTLHGYIADCADTFFCGNVSDEARKLYEVTKQSFYEGIKFAKEGKRVSDISHAIGEYAESRGYAVVREYTGHGVGTELHEDPEIPNYGEPGRGPRLSSGMTLAIEPMINIGTEGVKVLKDDWTVVTMDGSLSAHYENTILITDGLPEILTPHDEEM